VSADDESWAELIVGLREGVRAELKAYRGYLDRKRGRAARERIERIVAVREIELALIEALAERPDAVPEALDSLRLRFRLLP
jgi:hypothetical protein